MVQLQVCVLDSTIKCISDSSKYTSLIREFIDLIKMCFKSVAKHAVQNYIKTTEGPPICCKPARLPHEKLQIVKKNSGK